MSSAPPKSRRNGVAGQQQLIRDADTRTFGVWRERSRVCVPHASAGGMPRGLDHCVQRLSSRQCRRVAQILCTNCFHEEPRGAERCVKCGSADLLRADSLGNVFEVPPGFLRCETWRRDDATLELRRYRKVLGLFAFDRTSEISGYICRSCQPVLFREYMTSTLMLGWWEILDLLVRMEIGPVSGQAESDGFAWPHRDGLKWPHFAMVDVLWSSPA